MVPKHWLGCQAQLLQAKGLCGGEMGTYLGNLCFSFLRLCLVGGTDTRHWAISSYWALVSIMLGQGSLLKEKDNSLDSASILPFYIQIFDIQFKRHCYELNIFKEEYKITI